MTIETPNFESMTKEKLQEYATHMRIAVPANSNKADIIKQLLAKLNGKVMPELASTGQALKPGYARIRVLEDSSPGAANYPVFINANGYVATLPRGKEIVVPMRVVRVLNDAIVARRRQNLVVDQHGREVFKETTVNAPSFPFTVIEMNPGTEPLTKLEEAKRKSMAPKRRYRAIFQRWPRPGELTRAIEKGLISLKDDEVLGDAEQKSLDAAQGA